MKKTKWRTVFLCLAASVLCVGLSGCAKQKFDAVVYVKEALDANFKNEISDNYAALTEGGKEDAQERYDQLIAGITRVSEMDITDETKEKYKTAYEELLKASAYTVSEAREQDDGSYTVTVEMKPLLFDFNALMEERGEYVKEWVLSHLDQMDPVSMRDAAVEFESGRVQEFAQSPVYGEPETVEVKVVKNGKYYEITVDSMDAVWELVIGR